jgi:RNA polymerase sigma-70 factor (ECF subfamily)
MDELEILAGLQRGDQALFSAVVDRYQKMILNLTYKFLRDRESAEDLTQEVFIEVFESLPRFRGEAKLSTWIYRIAITRSLNYLKSQKRKKRLAVLVSLFDGGEAENRLPSPASLSPDTQLENQDRRKFLFRALDKLPDAQRTAFTLSAYDGLSYGEISTIMRTTIPSVESLIFRARSNLKKTLSRDYKEQI